MKLFGKKETRCCSGSGEQTQAQPAAEGKTSSVKVLGSGCAKCNALEGAVKEALAELGMDTTVEHVTDFAQIASYGVMSTPALVVDGKVVSFGRVLTKDAVTAILKKVRG
ncbi:MAG TPA: thioredoxin family protein [Treponema sp.]|nr:thioredoxin family protein [Treponema sp.]